MVLYLDENRYAVAGTLQADLTSVATAISQERMIKTSMLTASGVKGAERLVTGLHSDFYALGNMQFSFLAFLGSNLVPGVIMLAAILSFVSSIVRENYQYRINDWFDTAKGSVTAALFGKLLPHFFFYSLLIAPTLPYLPVSEALLRWIPIYLVYLRRRVFGRDGMHRSVNCGYRAKLAFCPCRHFRLCRSCASLYGIFHAAGFHE